MNPQQQNKKRQQTLILNLMMTLSFFSLVRSPFAFAEDVCDPKDLHSMIGVTRTHTTEELLQKHRHDIATGKVKAPISVSMVFEGGPKNKDLYNSPGEFVTKFKGKKATLFAGREESTQSETDMQVAFYLKTGEGHYSYLNLDPTIPSLKLQDPAIMHMQTKYGNELLLCGVKVWPIHVEGKEVLNYATEYFRDYGKGIENLKSFLMTADHSKDVRIVQDLDHVRNPADGFDVLTRPQHEKHELGGRGQVGILHVNSLEEMNAEKLAAAPIIANQVPAEEWLGANWANYLDKNTIGVIGHYARYAPDGIRDYVGVAWKIDTRTHVAYDVKVILERADLPGGFERPAKTPGLKRIVFPQGARRNADGTYTIWGGDGDLLTFQAIIPDPFKP